MSKIKKPSKLADQVILRLQKEITSGKFKEGDKIPAEPELMERYNVGRSTIREAIKTLANIGVLYVQQGSGTFVTSGKNLSEPLGQRLRRAEVNEVNEVRTLLEQEIIRLAVTNRKAKDIKTMQQALTARGKAIDAGDYETCKEADINFHTAIAKASGNSVLADLYETFTHSIRSFFHHRDVDGDINVFAGTTKLHEQLFAAIESQNEKKALSINSQILANK
jgi:DNA-binding FadR family transcriptional regulator